MDVQKLGAFIQSRRKDLGMTQGELGAKLNVTDKAISRWERGVGFPDIKLLEPLAEALQISILELMRCEQAKPCQDPAEAADQAEETALETKKEPQPGRYRRVFAVLCFLIYALVDSLSGNPLFTDQLVWMSPLNRVVFVAAAVSLIYASFREVSHDTV